MNDLDVLKMLEENIGIRIPICREEEKLPLLICTPKSVISDKDYKLSKIMTLPKECFARTFEGYGVSLSECVSKPVFGAYINQHGHIVGLALTGLDLRKVPEIVWRLIHLQVISFIDNELSEIPKGILDLPSIQGVGLSSNKINALPAWIVDTDFHPICDNFFDNNINEKDSFLLLKLILLYKNKLQYPPPEIIFRGKMAIKAYFESLIKGARPLNEVKIMIVGDGGSGKTSVARRLMGKAFNINESQTHGINIDTLDFKVDDLNIGLHVWDFGGQEIMHATHLFFLSERSLYILVLDGRKEEYPEYWLKHIESFGGGSPILVILNKIDEHPAFDVNRRFLLRKYRGILGFYPVSCKTDIGVDVFKNGIEEGLKTVDIIQTTWPESWFLIKDELEKMTSHYISIDKYEGLCQKVGISMSEHQDNLVQFLHDLGVIVHFRDFHLSHMHILNPKWLTSAVYRIINDPILAERRGMLKLSSLSRILMPIDDGFTYPSYTHSYILEIMKKFELCYSVNNDTILIPDLLDIQEPQIDFDYKNSLNFNIEYDFLPKSVMPRFIVKMNRDILNNQRWRTGVVIKNLKLSSTAVIRSDSQEKKIYVYVGGDNPWSYITVIRSVFLDINMGFEKITFKEKVCMPDNNEIAVSFDHLLHLMSQGIKDVYPDGALHSYKVAELLGIPSAKNERSEEDFIKILKELIGEDEERESAMKKANRVFKLQPSIYGVGIDLNAAINLLLKGKENKKK